LEYTLSLSVTKTDVAIVKLCTAKRVVARFRTIFYNQRILNLAMDAREVFIVHPAILTRRGPLQFKVNGDKPFSKPVINVHDLIVLPNHDVRTIGNNRNMSPLWY
jgi:hypothetical protein